MIISYKAQPNKPGLGFYFILLTSLYVSQVFFCGCWQKMWVLGSEIKNLIKAQSAAGDGCVCGFPLPLRLTWKRCSGFVSQLRDTELGNPLFNSNWETSLFFVPEGDSSVSFRVVCFRPNPLACRIVWSGPCILSVLSKRERVEAHERPMGLSLPRQICLLFTDWKIFYRTTVFSNWNKYIYYWKLRQTADYIKLLLDFY